MYLDVFKINSGGKMIVPMLL